MAWARRAEERGFSSLATIDRIVYPSYDALTALAAAAGATHRSWAGESVTGDGFPVGPAPASGDRIPILIGGASDAAVDRTVKHAEGWTAGGGGPQMAAPMLERIRRAWRDGGREGEPRFAALVYFVLCDDEASRASLRQYYGFLGQWVDAIIESAVRTPKAAKDIVAAYADVGMTEIVFDPTVASLDEVDRLADAVL